MKNISSKHGYGEDLNSSNRSISQCAAGSKGYGPVGVPTSWPPTDANCPGSINQIPQLKFNWDTHQNNLIKQFDCLNNSYETFKIKCKNLLLFWMNMKWSRVKTWTIWWQNIKIWQWHFNNVKLITLQWN